MWADEEKAVRAFRTGTGVPWGEHDERLFCGVASFYRNAYAASLVPEWLPALDGTVAKLEAGARVEFLVGSTGEYGRGDFDLICFFGAFHDLGDPLGAAAEAHRALAPGGQVMLIEPFAADSPEGAVGPVAQLYYAASTTLCTAHAISEGAEDPLGAQAGEERLRAVFEQAGFGAWRRATETPFNLVLEARAS